MWTLTGISGKPSRDREGAVDASGGVGPGGVVSDCIRFPRLKAEPCDVEGSFVSGVSGLTDVRGCCARSMLPGMASTSIPCDQPICEGQNTFGRSDNFTRSAYGVHDGDMRVGVVSGVSGR